MSFASDNLYNGYLRRNMPTIVTKVKVREIIIHLPCLTAHDRETIEAKRETSGNFNGMVLLLDCLKRREDWPEQFIEALMACEHRTIAAEIRAEYNALRGATNANPSSPPTTVIRAHIHPTPAASHLSVPESTSDSQGAVAAPAAAPAPPEPAVEATVPPVTCVQPEAQDPVASPPPVFQLPQPAEAEVVLRTKTPPPSPETQHPPATPPAPQRETLQQPEQNIQESSVDIGVSPKTSSVSSIAAAQPSCPAEQRESEAPSPPDAPRASGIKVSSPQRPSPRKINSSVSSYTMTTPERSPVQDTTPHDETPAQQPVEASEPSEGVASSSQTQSKATTSTPSAAVVIDISLCDDASVSLSKPGRLISMQPLNQSSPATTPPVEPYSGNSDRLQMSDSAQDTAVSASGPACSAETTVFALENGCHENDFPLNHNQPEENHYESPCQSLGTQEVLENVVHLAEEPSVLNLDGQSSVPQLVNGEAAREISFSPPMTTGDAVSSLNCHPSEPTQSDTAAEMKTPQDPKEKIALRTQTQTTKYILTAAGVGACALLMAWKFKN